VSGSRVGLDLIFGEDGSGGVPPAVHPHEVIAPPVPREELRSRDDLTGFPSQIISPAACYRHTHTLTLL
jgi:hypothetical protein